MKTSKELLEEAIEKLHAIGKIQIMEIKRMPAETGWEIRVTLKVD